MPAVPGIWRSLRPEPAKLRTAIATQNLAALAAVVQRLALRVSVLAVASADIPRPTPRPRRRRPPGKSGP